jgi:hypothetical protein
MGSDTSSTSIRRPLLRSASAAIGGKWFRPRFRSRRR